MATMAKKKDERATPRRPVQIPVDWYTLARQIAAHRKQPTVWMLIALLAEEAERIGIDHPPYPWEPDE